MDRELKKTNRLLIVIYLSLTVIAAFSGCSRDNVPSQAGQSRIRHEELLIQNDLNSVSSWRDYLETDRAQPHIVPQIGKNVNKIKDPTLRMKYFNRFADIPFSYPLDAQNPETRGWQFFAFSEFADSVANCAYSRNDIDSYWRINIRRFKRIQDEMRNVGAFLDGSEVKEHFKGDLKGWQEYHERVEGEYYRLDRGFSRNFGCFHTVNFLSYERWAEIRSQLEEMLGHEVNVWPAVIDHWKKMGKSISPIKSDVRTEH